MPREDLDIRILWLPGQDDLPLPSYQTEGASGMDVAAAVASETVLKPGEIAMIPLGFRLAIPRDYEIQVRPRSGLAARHGIGLVNSPGTIDSDYRGEISVILINFGKNDFTVTRGMRIAQLVCQKCERVRLVPCLNEGELGETGRGDGGFGHTGA